MMTRQTTESVTRRLTTRALAVLALLGVVGGFGPLAADGAGDRLGPPIPKKILTPKPSSTGDAVKEVATKPAGRFSPVLPPKGYKPPELALSEERFNFGTVFKGEEITHDFVVENKGGSELIIQKIKPGCGCTYVKHDRNIAPGEKGTITLKLNTKKLRGGKIAKFADVHCNDPKALKTRIFMEGKIATAFEHEPKSPRLEAIKGSEDAVLAITLRKAVEHPFKITNIKALNNRVSVELEEKTPGELYKLLVTAEADANARNSYFSDRIEVEVEGEVDGEPMTLTQSIPVTIRLKDRISCKPPRTVYFRRPEVAALRQAKDGEVTKEVIVHSEVGEAHKFNITSIELSEERFKAAVETVTEGLEYKVIIRIDSDSLPTDASVKSLKGDLIIHTDDPSQPKISMRVLAFI